MVIVKNGGDSRRPNTEFGSSKFFNSPFGRRCIFNIQGRIRVDAVMLRNWNHASAIGDFEIGVIV